MPQGLDIPTPEYEGQLADLDLCASAWLHIGSAVNASLALQGAGWDATQHRVRKSKPLYKARKRAASDSMLSVPGVSVGSQGDTPLLARVGLPPDDGLTYVKTWIDVARALGVDRSRIGVWRGMGSDAGTEDFPEEKDGFICVEAVAAWREANVGAATTGRHGVAGASTSLKDRKLQLEIEERERKAALESGQLLHRRDAEATLVARADALSRAMQQIVQKHAEELVGIASVHEAREKLRSMMETLRGVYVEESQGVAA